MTELPLYFAWYYVLGMVLMALFIRLYLRKRRMRDMEPPPRPPDTEDDN